MQQDMGVEASAARRGVLQAIYERRLEAVGGGELPEHAQQLAATFGGDVLGADPLGVEAAPDEGDREGGVERRAALCGEGEAVEQVEGVLGRDCRGWHALAPGRL
jgi:hypothetical protein